MNENCLVSIVCTTYNHEQYIRSALDGFLLQKTNFTFEIIVHDDASTDETSRIIKEYESKYPNLFRCIYRKENWFSQGKNIWEYLFLNVVSGKYIALCEGDDYWFDPLKLQKQIDFLEIHPNYSMCFHAAKELWQSSGAENIFAKIDNRDYSGKEIFNKWVVATASVVFKREIICSKLYKDILDNPDFLFGDNVLFLCAAEMGRIWGMKECMSVYRRHEGGLVFTYSRERLLKMNVNDMAVYKLFGRKYKKVVINRICKRNIYAYFRTSIQERSSFFYLIIKAFKLNPLLSFVYLFYAAFRYGFKK